MLFLLLLSLAHADFTDRFNAENNALPEQCRIRSPQMKLVYACSKLETPNANPRFYGLVEHAQSRSKFCYNMLIDVRKIPSAYDVVVYRDDGALPKYMHYRTWVVAGEHNYRLEGSRGYCAVTDKRKKQDCQGFNEAQAGGAYLRFNDPGDGKISQELSLADEKIKASRPFKPDHDTGTLDLFRMDRLSVTYARAQLLARAQEPARAVSKDEYENFKACNSQLIEMENALKPPLKSKPDEDRILNAYREKMRPTNPAGTVKTSEAKN